MEAARRLWGEGLFRKEKGGHLTDVRVRAGLWCSDASRSATYWLWPLGQVHRRALGTEWRAACPFRPLSPAALSPGTQGPAVLPCTSPNPPPPPPR